MRIGSVSTPQAGGPRRPLRGQAGCALAQGDVADQASPAEAAAPATQAAILLPLGRPGAEEAPRAAGDGAAEGHGQALLRALAGLQLASLGTGEACARDALAALAQDLPSAGDPRLDAVLKAIAQRAAVELARFG